MGLLDWLLPGRNNDADDPEVAAGVERLIRTVDSRLKAVSNVNGKLAPAVRTALDFCHATIDNLPGPLDAAPDTWRNAPELRALFTRSDELQQIFSRQEVIQDFAAEHPGCDVIYAIVSALLQEKKSFGTALEGDQVLHDVAVTALNFSRHRLHVPAGDETSLNQALVWALFDQMGIELLTRLTRMKEDREDLKEEIALLRTHLAQLEHQGMGDALASDDGDDDGTTGTSLSERLTARLKAREEALSQARRRLLTLDDSLGWISECLANPGDLIDVDQLDYRVDSVNQLVPPDQDGLDLRLSHFRFSAPTPRQGVILRVRYPRSALIPRQELNRDIERLFG